MATSITDLATLVYELTKRPDLVDETKSAIKAATLKAHMSDYYSKDIYEMYVNLSDTTSKYIWSLDYITLMSNFRSLKYIRKYDSDAGEPSDFIEVITPNEVLDSYKVTKTDVCYVAGRVIEIRSSTAISKLILAAYVNPIITDADYSSWVAELYPYAIVYEAARIIFKTIGYDEQFAAYKELVADQYILLQRTALTDVGY